MNNSILTASISKYLCIESDYLTLYLGKTDKNTLSDIWDDIKSYTSKMRVKCSSDVITNRYSRHNGYTFSRSLNSTRHLVDRQNFLESVKKLRYYISGKYPIDLYNIPLSYFVTF